MIAETDALPRQFRKSDVFESVAADVIWRLFFNGMNIQINPVKNLLKGTNEIEKKNTWNWSATNCKRSECFSRPKLREIEVVEKFTWRKFFSNM